MSSDYEEDRSISAETDAEHEERRARRASKKKERDKREAYQRVMSTEAGRAVLWDILSDLGTFKSPLVPGAQDLTYCAIGRQNAGLELMARLHEASPSGYITMQQENGK